MKIYVRNNNAILNKKFCIGVLEKIGIFKENIVFSDCYKNNKKYGKCDCGYFSDLKEDSILISFGSGVIFEPIYFNLFKYIFRGKYRKKIRKILEQPPSLGGYYGCLKNQVFIEIMVGRILEGGNLIKSTLKHELLHIKFKDHCNDKKCFFSESGSNEKLCDYHQKEFDNLINNINKEDKFENFSPIVKQ